MVLQTVEEYLLTEEKKYVTLVISSLFVNVFSFGLYGMVEKSVFFLCIRVYFLIF